MDASSTELGSGRLLGGRYRLGPRIASGGMASVWEAEDEVLARPVAVKLLHPHLAADETFVARFRREALAAARLTHPSIVSIYDTVSDHGEEAIVMELVRGHTLRAELDRRGPLPAVDAAAVVAQVADALAVAHAAGIVHRDIKPANVLLSLDHRVLVADFGIAKAADGLELTGTDTTLGTAKYLAPEQVEGAPVDGRADVYALGVILYELLCGQPPFVADTEAATALARLHRDAEPLGARCEGLAPELEAVVMRALARRPDDRFESAEAFARAVRQATGAPPGPSLSGRDATSAAAAGDPTRAGDRTTAAPSATRAEPLQARREAWPAPAAKGTAKKKRWWPVVALVAPVVVALVVVAILLVGTGDDDGGGPEQGPVPGAGLALAAAPIAFDPAGDGRERDSDLPNLVDGDLATEWSTEGYNERNLAGKPGVGVIVELAEAVDVERLVVQSSSAGWAASVYVVDEAGGAIEDWGAPVGQVADVAGGSVDIDLEDASGRFVLLWFTDPGPADDADGKFRVTIAELQLQ